MVKGIKLAKMDTSVFLRTSASDTILKDRRGCSERIYSKRNEIVESKSVYI